MSARPAARLYIGHVMHMRLIPKRHRFRHRVFWVLVDLDRMEETVARLRLLALDRFALMSLNRRDHGPRDGSRLRPWAEAELAKVGIDRPARIEMLSFPRMLGYGFNPLTVYYAFDGADRLTGVLYEVKNTFGDQIAYALPAAAPAGGTQRHAQRKEMYVSPFIGMEQTYRFTLAPPDDRLALRIRQAGPEGETLIATLNGRARPLTDTGLARAFLTHPLMSLGVIVLIHWHALRLFLKGVRYRPYRKVGAQ